MEKEWTRMARARWTSQPTPHANPSRNTCPPTWMRIRPTSRLVVVSLAIERALSRMHPHLVVAVGRANGSVERTTRRDDHEDDGYVRRDAATWLARAHRHARVEEGGDERPEHTRMRSDTWITTARWA